MQCVHCPNNPVRLFLVSVSIWCKHYLQPWSRAALGDITPENSLSNLKVHTSDITLCLHAAANKGPLFQSLGRKEACHCWQRRCCSFVKLLESVVCLSQQSGRKLPLRGHGACCVSMFLRLCAYVYTYLSTSEPILELYWNFECRAAWLNQMPSSFLGLLDKSGS